MIHCGHKRVPISWRKEVFQLYVTWTLEALSHYLQVTVGEVLFDHTYAPMTTPTQKSITLFDKINNLKVTSHHSVMCFIFFFHPCINFSLLFTFFAYWSNKLQKKELVSPKLTIFIPGVRNGGDTGHDGEEDWHYGGQHPAGQERVVEGEEDGQLLGTSTQLPHTMSTYSPRGKGKRCRRECRQCWGSPIWSSLGRWRWWPSPGWCWWGGQCWRGRRRELDQSEIGLCTVPPSNIPLRMTFHNCPILNLFGKIFWTCDLLVNNTEYESLHQQTDYPE